MEELLKFEMPGLNKYWFFTNGEVQNKASGEYVKMKKKVCNRQQYDVYLDGPVKKRTTITIQEIIAYGKHISFLDEVRYIKCEMRIPSKLNT